MRTGLRKFKPMQYGAAYTAKSLSYLLAVPKQRRRLLVSVLTTDK